MCKVYQVSVRNNTTMEIRTFLVSTNEVKSRYNAIQYTYTRLGIPCMVTDIIDEVDNVEKLELVINGGQYSSVAVKMLDGFVEITPENKPPETTEMSVNPPATVEQTPAHAVEPTTVVEPNASTSEHNHNSELAPEKPHLITDNEKQVCKSMVMLTMVQSFGIRILLEDFLLGMIMCPNIVKYNEWDVRKGFIAIQEEKCGPLAVCIKIKENYIEIVVSHQEKLGDIYNTRITALDDTRFKITSEEQVTYDILKKDGVFLSEDETRLIDYVKKIVHDPNVPTTLMSTKS